MGCVWLGLLFGFVYGLVLVSVGFGMVWVWSELWIGSGLCRFGWSRAWCPSTRDTVKCVVRDLVNLLGWVGSGWAGLDRVGFW